MYGATTSGKRLHTVATTKGRYRLRVAMCGRTLPRRLSWTETMERDECQHCRRVINKAYDIVNPDPHARVIHIPAHRIRGIAERGTITSRQRQALRKRQAEEERRERLWHRLPRRRA